MNNHILDCGHNPSSHSDFTTGYGEMDGKKHCYDCIAEMDKKSMIETGHSKHLPLYLSNDHVGNWPGSLQFPIYYTKKSRHNIAGNRYDVWFNGPDGHVWHGTQYGDWTQIVHCKRTKELVK